MNLYIALSPNTSKTTHEFYGTLTPDLIVRYKNIVAERSTIYIKGTGLGILLGLVIAYFIKNKTKISSVCRLCLICAVTLVTNIFFYLLHPKSDYMVKHLTTQQQRDAWIRCNRSYQLAYITGLFLGGASAYFLACGTCY